MHPFWGIAVLTVAWSGVASGCEEVREGESYCEVFFADDRALAKRCDCPWRNCVQKTREVYQCEGTDMVSIVGSVVMFVLFFIVVVCTWCCCCKGPGCTCTPACKGGLCCSFQQDAVPTVYITEGSQPIPVAIGAPITFGPSIAPQQHPLEPRDIPIGIPQASAPPG
eukprot:TRINITY_DN15822_c0_g1_i1.p2 TRINITY_DN15822_c0_g1~~TRINITY_DN15822_c0_g1_i1.p2  ORF type:complete len:167 (+),score=8.57 TRINITY_DN15822_c0_g1_i1:46-546(+)